MFFFYYPKDVIKIHPNFLCTSVTVRQYTELFFYGGKVLFIQIKNSLIKGLNLEYQTGAHDYSKST